MADPLHLALLRQGKRKWNRWRRENPGVIPDLSENDISELEAEILSFADVVAHEAMPGRAPASDGPLVGLDLIGVNLRGACLVRTNLSRGMLALADLGKADLRGANLAGAVLTSAKLTDANLTNANLHSGILRFATLRGAKLDGAVLRLANLDQVDARRASLSGADLSFASLTEAKLDRADLSGAFIYGASAWNVSLVGATQNNLRITRTNEGVITVDDIRIGQFIYLILNNRNVRSAIDNLTTKIVLILGRFSVERKHVLDNIKVWLSAHNYVPILFDFERPSSRDLTETVVTLAHLARFIIADLTDPTSVPKELEAIVPALAVPVQPLLQSGKPLYTMFGDYWKYDWVLPVQRYSGIEHLLAEFGPRIITPMERKVSELARRRILAGRPS